MKNFTFKKNVLLSATALSLALATNANAAINVQTGTTDITADVINAVVNNAKYAITATEPDKASYTYTAPDGSQADLNTTQTAADYKADSAAASCMKVSAPMPIRLIIMMRKKQPQITPMFLMMQMATPQM